MSASRVVWGQIVVVFAIVLFAVWVATQWVAWRLGFQPQLGSPWFALADVPIYPPPALFWWWFFFDAYAPRIFLEGAGIAASGGLAAIAVAILMSIYRAREAKDVRTFGSARWASPDEIKSAGLLGDHGVVLGRLDRTYQRMMNLLNPINEMPLVELTPQFVAGRRDRIAEKHGRRQANYVMPWFPLRVSMGENTAT